MEGADRYSYYVLTGLRFSFFLGGLASPPPFPRTYLFFVNTIRQTIHSTFSLYCLGDIPVYLLKYFPKNEYRGKFSEYAIS